MLSLSNYLHIINISDVFCRVKTMKIVTLLTRDIMIICLLWYLLVLMFTLDHTQQIFHCSLSSFPSPMDSKFFLFLPLNYLSLCPQCRKSIRIWGENRYNHTHASNMKTERDLDLHWIVNWTGIWYCLD